MTPNANRKIVTVANSMGIQNANKQQGTTRIIYDALPITSSATTQTLRFFENVNNRKFPFTNLNDNKLNVGETLALQYFSVSIMNVDSGTDKVGGIQCLDNLNGGTNSLYRSDLTVKIAEDTVVKKLPLQSMFAPFNKDSKFYGNLQVNPGNTTGLWADIGRPHDCFHFVNPIILVQQLELVIELQIPAFTGNFQAGQDYYLVLTLEGLGSLFAPKTAY